ncbi:MAG: FkbM family methyltransferase [Anaerolineae bacterium]|nr:FkbM family methyltransferase [Anaerolineae bacterium]
MNRYLIRDVTFLFANGRQPRPYPNWKFGAWRLSTGFLPRLRRRLWHNLDAPGLVRWLAGLRIYIYPNEEICRSIFVTGSFEPNQFAFLNNVLTPGMTFVDVGANMGLYTLFAAQKVGQSGSVLAIEPSQREFERLTQNVAINRLNNVRLRQLAVSNCQAEAELLIAREDHPGHNTLGAFGYDSVKLQRKEKVAVERLDDLVEQESLYRVDVIKMDIEGAEFLALQGAENTIARFRPVLLLELSDRTLNLQGCNSRQVWDFLTRFDYHIYKFDQQTGLPVIAQPQSYFDAENIVALPNHREQN